MIFKTLDECYEYAYSLLESDGYFNDESSGLSTYLQHHSETVISVMKEKGYDGPLSFEGGYYNERGALYWLFDENRMDRDKAIELTNKWVKSQQEIE
ncbi:hypothetical protein [Rodentibacter pneumotropicus]|uniref:Uncharacterized protein n=1 Tax=Rodentibacter pneumotropicus TaxID=758 RepID=A0A448MIS7_9PAST|nr:hypothetical protein [Rodentibacter pneumotropicus]NBH76051.1 hypothetical protein [Rodentibacter pneumotropicus]OOF64427.1 hypothetical protein BH925_06320 [Rodentibacter pneumotropicus]THA03226.1 hypothetical protein D3M72_04380 [Rodentibacter pneumotropicus]THA07350.1 hypothetical protein D3M78_09600 [Rodentibacter pneumotropicus]THA07410.1 hypothetical protein D3M73_02495 [Rodentibacter pneumotropicus]